MQTLELTHRLKELREKEAALLKETETYRDQLSRICREKASLELQVQQTTEQRDQALTRRAWWHLSTAARYGAVFAVGFACCYTIARGGDWLLSW